MRRARPSELKEDAVPALVLSIDPRRLRELFPVRFSRVDSFAEPEPSKGALIQLNTGPYAMVMYGTETRRATISFPAASDVRRGVAALLRETPIHRDEIEWMDELANPSPPLAASADDADLLTEEQDLQDQEPDKLKHRVERVSLDSDNDQRLEEIPSDDDVEGLVLAHVMLGEFEKAIDDPVLLEYVALLAEDSGSSAREIAKRMGVTVKAIYRLNRKLARRRSLWGRSSRTA